MVWFDPGVGGGCLCWAVWGVGGEHVAGVVLEEEAVDLAGEEVEVHGFSQDGEGMESEGLGQETLSGLMGQEDAGEEGVVLADDLEGFNAGEVVEAGIEDGQMDLGVGDEANDLGGGVGQEGVDTAGLKDGADGLGPSPVSIAKEHVHVIGL